MRRTSLRDVVDRAFRAVVAGSVAVVVVVGSLLLWLTTTSRPEIDHTEQALIAVQAGHTAMLDQESNLRGFISTDDLAFVTSYNKARGDLEPSNTRLLKVGVDRRSTEAIVGLRLAQQRWTSEWAAVAGAGFAPGTVGSDERATFLLQDKVLFDAYTEARDRATDVLTAELVQHRRAQDLALFIVAGACVVIVGCVSIVSVRRRGRLHRDLMGPVEAVLEGFEQVAQGRLDEPVTADGPLELEAVVVGMNRMTRALAESRDRTASREQQVREQSQQLRSILAMVREIGGSLNLEYVVDAVVEGVARIARADRAVIWLVSPDGGSLVPAQGARRRVTGADAVELGSGPIGRAAKYSRMVRTACVDEREGQRLAVPLVVGSRVVGVLDVERADATDLADADIEVLETLAIHSATALEAARLHEDAAHASEHDALTQPAQPPPARQRPGPGVRAQPALRPAARLRDARPRPLQAGQRRARAHPRRRGAADRGRPHRGRACAPPTPPTGTAARSLAVILRESDLAAAQAVAERLRARIETVFAAPGEVGVTASLGIAEIGPATAMPSALVAAADAALYRAKREGRNAVRSADPAAPATLAAVAG
nr:GAF domain-containing protein [Angustibacter aerolatus]